MDIILIGIIGLSALAIGALFGLGDDGGDDEEPPGDIGRSEVGAGGYGPGDAFDLVWGTSVANELTGTGDEWEVINAYDGNDTVDGLGGNDRIFAHKGDDLVNAGAGDDTVE